MGTERNYEDKKTLKSIKTQTAGRGKAGQRRGEQGRLRAAWHSPDVPDAQLTLLVGNRFAWITPLSIWNRDTISLSLAPRASRISPGGLGLLVSLGSQVFEGQHSWRFSISFTSMVVQVSFTGTFPGCPVCRKHGKTCLGWIQKKWKIIWRYL